MKRAGTGDSEVCEQYETKSEQCETKSDAHVNANAWSDLSSPDTAGKPNTLADLAQIIPEARQIITERCRRSRCHLPTNQTITCTCAFLDNLRYQTHLPRKIQPLPFSLSSKRTLRESEAPKRRKQEHESRQTAGFTANTFITYREDGSVIENACGCARHGRWRRRWSSAGKAFLNASGHCSTHVWTGRSKQLEATPSQSCSTVATGAPAYKRCTWNLDAHSKATMARSWRPRRTHPATTLAWRCIRLPLYGLEA